MSIERLKLVHNLAEIATELEKIESHIVSISSCIDGDCTPYLKKKLLEKLDSLIGQRADLITDLNEAITSYNEYVESLKS